MTTKKNGTATKMQKNSRVKSDNVTLSGVNVAAPAGSGTTSQNAVNNNNGVVSGRSKRASRIDARAQLENAIIREMSGVSVRDLSAKVVAHFSAPEWAEYNSTLETLRKTFPSWNDDQLHAAVRGAAKNAGVDLSAPAVSLGRVLAVIRAHYLKEFVYLVGMSFNSVREIVRGGSLGVYTYRLSCGAVRANSVLSDFVSCESVDLVGASASSIVGALLSLRAVSDFRARLAAAKSDALCDFRDNLRNAIRYAKQLGLSDDDINKEIQKSSRFVSAVDDSARKRLRGNIEAAVLRVNDANDTILALGGASLLDVVGTPAKVCKSIKRALNDRNRAYSVIDTCTKLLASA